MDVTKNILKYINRIGMDLSDLAEQTGISYEDLKECFGEENHHRPLKANELTTICYVLKINPMDFAGENWKG